MKYIGKWLELAQNQLSQITVDRAGSTHYGRKIYIYIYIYMWHLTRDTSHVTHDMWYTTYDMWHVTCCSPDHVHFLVLPQQSSLLGIYRPVLFHLLGNTGKYSPSCQTNIENQLFQYCPTRKDNNGIKTFRNWECLYYDSSRDIQWSIAKPLENLLGSALGIYLMLRLYFMYIPPLVIIQIQCTVSILWRDNGNTFRCQLLKRIILKFNSSSIALQTLCIS